MSKIGLLETCNITTGKKDSNASVENGIYPFFTCAPEPLKINSYSFDDDVILLAGNNAGGNFHCQRYKGKFDAYQRTYILTAKNGYCLDYIFYSLILNLKQYAKKSQGSQTKFLTMQILKDFQIDNIPYDYQKKISNRLKNLDEKIALNNKINAELEETAKTLYDYWFTQFVFPDENGKPYKSRGGKMVYSETLHREIPVGWEVDNLMGTNFCKDIMAGVDYFVEKKYLPTANINGEDITDGENISYENRENRANMQPSKYSVWFAKMKNSIKHLSIPNNSLWFTEKYILSTGFQGLQCTENTFAYIHCVINSGWFETYKDILSHGATQEGVNNEDLKNIIFVCPSNEILAKFNSAVLPMLEKKFAIIKENQELAKLRDWLLPMLMNGQATICDTQEEKVIKPDFKSYDERFNTWLQTQGYAARGDVDMDTLKKIFDAMDEDDKK